MSARSPNCESEWASDKPYCPSRLIGLGIEAKGAQMLETLVLDRPPLMAGAGSTGPVPPGTGRVRDLIEWIGIAIFVALVVSTVVILIRNPRRATQNR